jgi:DNA-binding transcriptional MocR family regulator
MLDMEPGDCIFMEDFTLYDAMSAFEASSVKFRVRVFIEQHQDR